MADTFFLDRKFKIAFASWWVIYAAVQTLLLRNYDLPMNIAVVDSVVSCALLAGCCLLVHLNLCFYLPGQERYWYVLFISTSLALLWIVALRISMWSIYKGNPGYMQMLQQSTLLRLAFATLTISCMTLLSLSWYTQQDQKESQARRADAEKLAKDAELFTLRQQLQPHFLFNSLNSISALTLSQPHKARDMIQQLSDFLRGTLRKDDQAFATLSEELSYLELYLDIEKVRFGYRLQTLVAADETALNMKLPAMLLQPLVENAIKFGLYDTTGEVLITIKAGGDNGMLTVSVQNPYDAVTAAPVRGTGFGLSSIQRRLFLLFARHDLVSTVAGDLFFTTTITIPQQV